MATRDLDRLGEQVKAHRLELYPSRLAAAQAAGMSKDTWQNVEEGGEAQDMTYRKIEKALGWAAGSCLVVADGGSPVLASGTASDSAPAPRRMFDKKEARSAAFEAARKALPHASVGDIDAFMDEFVDVLRRTGQILDDE
jgi:hypothetical protein